MVNSIDLWRSSYSVLGAHNLLKLSGFIRIDRCHGFKCMNTLFQLAATINACASLHWPKTLAKVCKTVNVQLDVLLFPFSRGMCMLNFMTQGANDSVAFSLSQDCITVVTCSRHLHVDFSTPPHCFRKGGRESHMVFHPAMVREVSTLDAKLLHVRSILPLRSRSLHSHSK